jgi:predicted AlkP superfamily phosphohydrolase/phosphomutase
MKHPKVFVLGLDCAEPSLVFGPWLEHLPNFRAVIDKGLHGKLRSCDPPITVPAWSVMMSSRTPGSLGVYGFRNRDDHGYDKFSIANSKAIKVKRLWNLLGDAGKKVILIGVPQTYPPLPVNGILVGDFLTPDTKSEYTYPSCIRDEIREQVGEYLLDVRDFRTDNKDKILADIYEMTEKRFALARHFVTAKPWDYFMMVEMGTDRIHHAFWSYMDPLHRAYEKGHRFENAIFDYYRFVDRELGKLLELLDPETHLFIVSDHGAKRMDGGICVNDWLIREGYLQLKDPKPTAPTPFSKVQVDWDKTIAWGDGGYYARIFLNVKGREPRGIIPPGDYEKVRGELAEKIRRVPDDQGRPIPTRAYTPEELYPTINGVAPDLLVYWGGLYWRSVGSVGNSSIYTFQNDTGPDDANHAEYGMIIYRPPAAGGGGPAGGGTINDARLLDIAPTILGLFGMTPTAEMEGRPLCSFVSPK